MKRPMRTWFKDAGWGTAALANLAIAAMIVMPFTGVAAPEEKITICHATSSETNPFETIHVSANATAGHFENNGTTKAGHEGDFIINEPDALCPGDDGDNGEDDDTGTLVVEKVVVGGTAAADDFSIHVKNTSDEDVDNSPQAGDTEGTSYTLAVGTYTVSESGGPAGYTATFSSDCNSSGQIAVVEDQTVTCVLTNTFDDSTGGPEDVTVTIVKHLDGKLATASAANDYAFPMAATWSADNIGSGSGDFTLGPTGFNNPNPYHATTAEMSSGADYSAEEVTTADDSSSLVLPANDSCEDGKFRLLGYSTGNTLAEADNASVSATVPSFTDLVSDKFIIVHNETCGDDGGGQEPITTFHFIKQICASFSDIAGNEQADQEDDTDGHFDEFSNFNGGSFTPRPSEPVTPAEIPENCEGAEGWSFEVDSHQDMSSPTVIGSTDANGELNVPFAGLPTDVKDSLLAGGLMWVSEVTQNTADFGALRCYFDALNGDNLEFLIFGTDPVNNYPPDAYCIAYNVGDVGGIVDECPAQQSLLSGTETQFIGSTTTEPSDLSDDTQFAEGTAGAAVAASPTGFPGAWDAAASDPDVAGAVWVNNSATMPTNPSGAGGDGSVDSWRLFSHSFTIPGNATDATLVLHFTSDNSVTVFLDNVSIGTANDHTLVVDASELGLTTGTHTLEFAVKNDAFAGENNPTGLIYRADIAFCITDESNGGGGGGGSSSSSSRSSSGSSSDDDDDEGQVLGITFPGGLAPQVLGDTAQEVLGESDTLPRTGVPLDLLLLLFAPLLLWELSREKLSRS